MKAIFEFIIRWHNPLKWWEYKWDAFQVGTNELDQIIANYFVKWFEIASVTSLCVFLVVLLRDCKTSEIPFSSGHSLLNNAPFVSSFILQTILKDVCYENIDCILKLLDESGAENSTVIVLKKTERSFKGKFLNLWMIFRYFVSYKTSLN